MKTGNLNFGYEVYTNKRTGEEIEVPVIYQDAKDSNFVKIWLACFLVGMEELGNKKIKVLVYLLENRIVSHNMIAKNASRVAVLGKLVTILGKLAGQEVFQLRRAVWFFVRCFY